MGRLTRATLTLLAALLVSQSAGFAPTVPCSSRTCRSQSSSNVVALQDAAMIGGMDQTQLAEAGVVVVAIAAAAAAVAFQKDGDGDDSKAAVESEPEPEPEPIDVSIPYDAAARLAYDEWRSGDFQESEFQQFKEIYEKKSVAEVVASRYSRELAGMQES